MSFKNLKINTIILSLIETMLLIIFQILFIVHYVLEILY